MSEEYEPIAVLPLGATEQHGAHLPPDTDAVIAEAVARRAIEFLPAGPRVELLPVERIGYSIEHLDDAATRSLAFDEAVYRWIDIGAAQRRRGLRKFVMLNAHGGNSPLMTIVATELRVRHRMLAVATSWTRFGWPEGLIGEEEKAYGVHGGLVETSVMLALAPDRVDMGKAADMPSAQKEYARRFRHLRAYGPHAFGWKMHDLNPAGVTGNAKAATADLGRLLLDHAARGFCELLQDVDRFDPDVFG
jgi:creatinine amidohydrolase